MRSGLIYEDTVYKHPILVHELLVEEGGGLIIRSIWYSGGVSLVGYHERLQPCHRYRSISQPVLAQTLSGLYFTSHRFL